jgi:peptidoglycan/LPS O-acetylase OafA/YrhL
MQHLHRAVKTIPSSMANKKLLSLDALRGIAILLVIAAHFGAQYEGQGVHLFLGNAGVILFFFLSGFLMDKTLAEDDRVSAYAIRRAFRILPMYWLSLALVIAFGEPWAVKQLISNATFTAPAFGQDRMLGVYWTLYIEVLFYLIAPFLMRAGSRIVNVSTYAVLIVLSAIEVLHGVGSGAPFYVIFCLCGMQIGSWYRGDSKGWQIAASVIAVSAASCFMLPGSVFLGVIPLCCAAALAFCLRRNPSFRPLQFVGNVSYSWYLLHSIFGYKFLSLSIPASVALIIGVLITLAVSVLTYRTIEKPMLSLGKNFVFARAKLINY